MGNALRVNHSPAATGYLPAPPRTATCLWRQPGLQEALPALRYSSQRDSTAETAVWLNSWAAAGLSLEHIYIYIYGYRMSLFVLTKLLPALRYKPGAQARVKG